jgi:cysteine desulfurase
MLFGGGQESGVRAGTESVALIAGLGAAARVARVEADATMLHMLTLKQRLISGLKNKFSDSQVRMLELSPVQTACYNFIYSEIPSIA